jgi:hypothetical protein
MSGGRLLICFAALFGAVASFLPWAAWGFSGDTGESGLRLGFGIPSLLGFAACLVVGYVTRSNRSTQAARRTILAISCAVLATVALFAAFHRQLWRAVAMQDYPYLSVGGGAGAGREVLAVGWYLALVSAAVLAVASTIASLWRPQA